jgi:hypothetical protein
MPDDDIPFNFDMVSFLISLIDNEVSKSLSRVRLGFNFASSYDCSIRFRNCSDIVVFFHCIHLL